MTNIERVAADSLRIISAIQNAILTSMRTASENVEEQVRIAEVMQRLETREMILNWLCERKAQQESRLQESLHDSQRTLIAYKIASIDEEIESLLVSAGIEKEVATHAIETSQPSRAKKTGKRAASRNGK